MSQSNTEQHDLRTNILYQQESSLRDILNVVFRHQAKITLFFVTVVSIVTLFTFLVPEIYQSDAKLLLQVGRENVAMDPTVSGPVLGLSQSRENELNSELAILKSRMLAEKVVEEIGIHHFSKRPDENLLVKLGIANTLTPVERATKIFMTNLDVSAEKKSYIISVNYQSKSPQLSQKSLSTLLEFYKDRHIEVNRMQASPTFFQQQADTLFAELTAKENQLDDYRSKNNITSLEIQKNSIAGQVNELQNSLDTVSSAIESSKAKINSLEKSVKNRPEVIEIGRTSGRTNYAADAIKNKILELQIEEKDLTARYQDDHRPLLEIRELIRLTESALAREEETNTEITTGLDVNYRVIQLSLENEKANFQSLVAQKTTITKTLQKRSQDATSLSDMELTMTRQQRDIKILEDEYLKYRDNLQRANISTALDMDKVSNVSVVQSATMPMSPVKPNKILNISLGLFLGLFGGLGLAFFVEYLDDTVKTNEDVEKRLGLPVLAAVSKEEFETCI